MAAQSASTLGGFANNVSATEGVSLTHLEPLIARRADGTASDGLERRPAAAEELNLPTMLQAGSKIACAVLNTWRHD